MKTIIDARGETCPIPVVKAKKALESTAVECLDIYVDNEIAVQNLEKLARQKGYQFVSEREDATSYRVELSKQGEIQNVSVEEEIEQPILSCTPGKKTVVISSSVMGTGDDELGAILMKGFLYALGQQEQPPSTIIMYNSGVKLAIQGSRCEEELKELEKAGVEIYVCGTCLNHYGLSDQLAVGNVTNMYDIVEKQMKASAVIRP